MPSYLYMCRPPGIGCQPDGFDPDSRENWYPAKQIGHRYFFGRVHYQEPLPLADVRKFDLWPEDIKERAELVFFREGEDAEWLRADYMAQPVEILREYAPRDQKAAAALVLLGVSNDPD